LWISARQRGPRGRQPLLTVGLVSIEVFLERFGEDPALVILGGQLLRTLRQYPEEADDPAITICLRPWWEVTSSRATT